MKRVFVVAGATLAALALACAPSADQADTMSVSTIDTLKAAPDSGAVPASAGATTATTSSPAGVTQSKGTTTPATKTGTKTAPVDTTNIGRDRAIPINTKDPKVRLPTVDTTKRPPGGA